MPYRRFLSKAIAPFSAVVFCVLFYSYTLQAWFQEDDFAWLGLGLTVHSFSDLMHALFAPMAQGTIRPISERAFFMIFFWLFGLDALPYRIAVLVTEIGNIILLSAIARRLTGSRWAAFIAPVVWIVNIGLAKPMTWTSAYNEILCAFVFLLSFFFLLRYLKTGVARYNLLQWAVFLLGFGVLEINVVYPLIAVLYTLLFAPRKAKSMSWMLLPSIAYGVIHAAAQNARQSTAIYRLHFDPASLVKTLAEYCALAFGGRELAIVLSTAVVVFVAVQFRERNMTPLFCFGWFIIALSPFLPVRDHMTDYYLAVPSIGVALLAAAAVGWAALGGQWWRHAAVYGMIAAYVIAAAPATLEAHQKIWAASQPVERLVLAVDKIHREDPGKIILLNGVDDSTFWNCIYGRPFRLLGIDNVYLTPSTVDRLTPYPELGNVADYILSEPRMIAALSENRARVFSADDGRLRDITAQFTNVAVRGMIPSKIEMGHPAIGSVLGPSWSPPEGDYCWMPKSATARLGIPDGTGNKVLRIEASCAGELTKERPLIVNVTANGAALRPVAIDHCDGMRDLSFAIDKQPTGRTLDLLIEVDRTVRVPPDQRDLGLAVRTIEVIKR